jgi:hypothetical protein
MAAINIIKNNMMPFKTDSIFFVVDFGPPT